MSLLTTSTEAVIYSRISIPKQDGGTDSLDAQFETCYNYADELGYNVIEYCNETGSAYKKSPKELTDLINRLENCHLLIAAVDRFSRSVEIGSRMIDLATERCITIHFVEENLRTDVPRLMKNIKMALVTAEDESLIKSVRIKKANAKRRAKGYKFGQPAYGYSAVKFGSVRREVENVREQQVLEFIMMASSNKFNPSKLNELLFKIKPSAKKEPITFYQDNYENYHEYDYCSTLRVGTIAKLLNDYEIYNRSNKRWTGQQIRRQINNQLKRKQKLIERKNMRLGKNVFIDMKAMKVGKYKRVSIDLDDEEE